MIKEKIPYNGKNSWVEPVRAAFRGEKADERDGVKVILTDSWIHVRPSNTEPVVRVIAEAPSQSEAEGLVRKVRDVLERQ